MNRKELIDFIIKNGNLKDKSSDFLTVSDFILRSTVQRIMSEHRMRKLEIAGPI